MSVVASLWSLCLALVRVRAVYTLMTRRADINDRNFFNLHLRELEFAGALLCAIYMRSVCAVHEVNACRGGHVYLSASPCISLHWLDEF